MFYLNTIEQLFLFVEQLDQFEVCLPYSRLLTGIPILAVFKNLRWNSNKTSLGQPALYPFLDWIENPGLAAGVVIVCSVILPLIHLALCKLSEKIRHR